MLQNKGYGFGIKTGVDGIQHGTAHRHTKVRFKHRGNIGAQERNGFAVLNPQCFQTRGQTHATLVGFTPGVSGVLMNLCGALRVNKGRALQIADRR